MALIEKLGLGEDMVQRKSKRTMMLRISPKITANYLFLINQTESDIPRVNKPSLDRLDELTREWNSLHNRAKGIGEGYSSHESKFWDAGVGAIWKN